MISFDFGQFEKLDFYHLPAHCAAEQYSYWMWLKEPSLSESTEGDEHLQASARRQQNAEAVEGNLLSGSKGRNLDYIPELSMSIHMPYF